MKNISRLIGIFSVLAIAGCSNKTDISQGAFAEILEEMYMADQYIDYDSNLSSLAEETFVYAPIIEKYGYSQEQFVNSLDYYRHNPDIFLDIMKEVKASLDNRFQTSRDAAQVFDFDEDDADARGSVKYENVDVIEESPSEEKPADAQSSQRKGTERKMSKKELKELKKKWN